MTANSDFNPDLDRYLPDELVRKDLRNVLFRIAPKPIELESGTIQIEPSAHLEIVSKGWNEHRFGIAFGNSYHVVIAIGGVSHSEYGILKAHLCFCTLWYDNTHALITSDFSANSPM